MEQGVVERLAAVLGRLDEHFQVFHHLLLPTEVAELQGAQGVLELALGGRRLRAVYVKIFFHRGKDTIFSAQNGHARHFLCGLPQEMPMTPAAFPRQYVRRTGA